MDFSLFGLLENVEVRGTACLLCVGVKLNIWADILNKCEF